eukprot:TRINITY_DN6546_c0_g2_i1.p1 TRINITY_DN6546_c0_g2~~TRINITY_DN6546_c0_g2_i1.p1  ORF type:complete len:179 (+),score=24.86 TRINITY_DN6546_c0_g2_i1:66-539(+)
MLRRCDVLRAKTMLLVDLARPVVRVEGLGRLLNTVRKEIGPVGGRYAFGDWSAKSREELAEAVRWGYQAHHVSSHVVRVDKPAPTHIQIMVKTVEATESDDPPEHIVISSRLAKSFSFLSAVTETSQIWFVVDAVNENLQEKGCGQIVVPGFMVVPA